MRPTSAITTLVILLGAVLGDWVYDALYFHRDEPVHVFGALAINLLAVALLLSVLSRVLGIHAFRRLVFVIAAAALGIITWIWLRSTWSEVPVLHKAIRVAALAALVIAAWWWSGRISNAALSRMPRAVAAATLAFALTPFVMSSTFAPSTQWPPIEDPASARQPPAPHNLVLLLLDELGDDAAQPIVASLEAAEFEIAVKSLEAAGDDTINVIPAMFTRRSFAQAKPCGPTALCSGRAMVDFAKVHASRPDIDVIAMYHRYCNIRGLRSCHEVEVPANFRNAYIGLANHYLARIGLPLKNADLELAVSTGLKGEVVRQQREALARAAFWDRGGVLYAHLPLPHPPGHGGTSSLNVDYETNLRLANDVVLEVAHRATARFGDDVTIFITSDHGLRRRIWCSVSAFNPYRNLNCQVRQEFLSPRVPLIAARKGVKPQLPAISNNRNIFDVIATRTPR